MKQGVRQASSRFLVDTPEYLLTLRYIYLNLALIGQEGRILSAGSHGVRRGPAGALECHGGRRYRAGHGLGPGNTNGAGGWVGTRYSTLPHPPSMHPPRVVPLPRTRRTRTTSAGEGAAGHPEYDSLESTKEILGVDNALPAYGIAQRPHASPYAGPAASSGACLWGLL